MYIEMVVRWMNNEELEIDHQFLICEKQIRYIQSIRHLTNY